jgi:4-hydroxy-L-threonine phosphate dehydrogenase PdxA
MAAISSIVQPAMRPLNKEAVTAGCRKFSGHTEYIAEIVMCRRIPHAAFE